MTDENSHLLSEIEDFLSEFNVSPSYFGKAACGNSELVSRLNAGGQVLPRTSAKIRNFIRKKREAKKSGKKPALIEKRCTPKGEQRDK